MADAQKAITKIFVFILPIIILLGYVEYEIRKSDCTSSYAVKKKYLEKELNNIETLVVGSSQIFNGVDVSMFSSNAFNLANVSQTLYYDKRLALKYLTQMPKLKTVVIGISYFSFFYQLCDTDEWWREKFYSTYFGINGFKNTKPSWLLLNDYGIKQSMVLALNSFKDASAISIENNGFQPKCLQKNINDSLGLLRVELHNKEECKKRRVEIQTDVEDFVLQLTNKKINVVFVTTPVYITYSKFCNKNVLLQNENFINSICSKYNCKYINLFTDNRFSLIDFEDNDHLNCKGAKKLGAIINDTLVKTST